MQKVTLKITTPAGEFTRTTAKPYKFAGLSKQTSKGSGYVRFFTHFSTTEAAAHKAANVQVGDWHNCLVEFLGVFPVETGN